MSAVHSARPLNADPARLAAAEAQIVRVCKQLDLGPLLRLLHALDYRGDDIEFRSQVTTLHQPSLVQAIEFRTSPRRAVVTLNVGLLATQSPLPTYVFRYIEAQSGSQLADFLGLCAHHLLRQLVASQAPELALAPAGLVATRQQTLVLLGLSAPSTVHWLFGHTFPELEVQVERGLHEVNLALRSVSLGRTVFGDGSTFGATSRVRLPGIIVRLIADTPLCGSGEPWTHEAPARMAAWLWPLCSQQSFPLEVQLIIRDAGDCLVLGPRAELGLQPFDDASPVKRRPMRRITLFRGDVSTAAQSGSVQLPPQSGGMP